MDRLTERIRNSKTGEVLAYRSKCQESVRAMQKLGELEDLEENGRLLKLPCAVGDTVYCIITSIKGTNPTIFSQKFDYSMLDDFGKAVFLTREEAEDKLKEMEWKK